MKSLIILTWAAIAHATCGYQHGIWKPRDGQDFSLVMKELTVNRKDIEKLNPDVDIDDIYPRIPYNVPFKVPQYSGQWTNGCPPLLIIRDTTDGLMTYSGLPSIWNAGNPHQTLTRTIQVAVDTKTRTITVCATNPPVQAGTELPQHSTADDPLSVPGTEEDVNNLSSYTKAAKESVQTNDGSIDTAHVSEPCSEAGLVDPSYSPSLYGQEKSPTSIRSSGEPAAPTSPKDTFRFSQATCYDSADIPPATQQDDEQSERLPSTTTGAGSVEPSKTQGGSSIVDEAAPTSYPQISGKETTGTVTVNPVTSPTSVGTVELETPTSERALSNNGDSDKKSQPHVQPTTNQETTRPCKEISEAEGTKESSVTTAKSKSAENAETKTGSGEVKSQLGEASNVSHKTTKVETAVTETDTPASEPGSSLAETGTTLATLPSKATPETSVTSALVSQLTLPKPICGKRVYEGYYLVFDMLVKKTSRAWCQEYAAGQAMQAGDERVSSTETDPIDREANYSISWVEDCIGHAQSMESPLGSYGPFCSEIFYDAVWWSCRKANNGFGGKHSRTWEVLDSKYRWKLEYTHTTNTALFYAHIDFYTIEKMLSSFHCFGSLPPELQEHIWKLSVRPTKPGVQVFSLSSSSNANLSNKAGTAVASLATPSYFSAPKWAFGPTSNYPQSLRDTTASWTHNNPSTYLFDSGLWSACIQSRNIIRNTLNEDKFLVVRTRANRHALGDTGLNISEASASRHRSIVVSPREDLFVLQLDHPDAFVWYLRDPAIPSETPAGSPQLRNVGWQYNPAWATSIRESPWSVGDLETLWLINYRIKRKYWVPSEEELNEPEPQIFEGDGFRFTEVSAGDDGPWDEVVDDCDPHTLADFIAFVELLQQLINRTLGSYQTRVGKQEINIKILACDPH
ncbi:hypothetical protein FBULB1_7929 [Fusarium bulbicola]|nr:hypothetical protein FBULB1_7929 [Fusarium bulbicola]